MKAVRERLNGLKTLRNQVSTRDSYLYGREEKKVVEPQYNVKDVDKKITELETFIFMADAKIKQANAITNIDIEANVGTLLAPLT